MLLSQLFKNVDSLNALNEKTGCSDVWCIDNDADSSWLRIYRKDCGLSALISAFDVECLLGDFNTPFLIGSEKIDGVQRIVLSVSKALIDL